MNYNDLDLPSEDSLVDLIEEIKEGLISTSYGLMGKKIENSTYRRIRKILRTNTSIRKLLPQFLLDCKNLSEASSYLNRNYHDEYEIEQFIITSFNSLIDWLEKEEESYIEIAEKYEDLGVIGEGGFGVVHKFNHKLMNYPFAIKFFAPSFYKGGDTELERFFQEAGMLMKLQHPLITKVYDVGLKGNRPYILMEFHDGLNLNEILKNKSFSLKEAIEIITQIVKALNYAHEEVKIIHRDLKPSNIMSNSKGQYKIIDFGLGIYIENELYSRISASNEQVVSGYYTAPELLKDHKLIDKRSDIYSLGAIWFTLLTGQPPAGMAILELLKGISGITNEYINCLERCLTDIENRHENCMELLTELNDLSQSLN